MARSTYWRHETSNPLHLLQNEFHRILADYLQPRSSCLANRRRGRRIAPSWSPRSTSMKRPDEMIVVAEVPGVDSASIELAITGNVLSLAWRQATRRPTRTNAPASRATRSGRSFVRSPYLNEVDFDNVQADASQGILKIRLPKLNSGKPRTIPINRRLT